MQIKLNRLGILSVGLFLCFWVYVHSSFGPNSFTRSPYVWFVLLPAILLAAAISAVAAALRGSKWWYLALLGPVSGAMLMRSASA